MRHNNAESDRLKMAIWRMRISRYVSKTTHARARSEYVILIAFIQQQWFYERASTVRFTYNARLVTGKYTEFINVMDE
jgi:hypothetical protein